MEKIVISIWISFFCAELALTTQSSASIWIGLGWKRISFFGFKPIDCAKLMATASQSAISSKCYHSYEQALDYSVPVQVAENETTLLGLLENSNVPAHSILYEVQDKDLRDITFILENLDLSKSFFLLHMKNNTTKSDLYNVHTFKDNKLVSMVKWTLNPTNVYFKEEFDLKGAHLKSSTLSWPPYVEIGKCKFGNKNCQVSGIVPEVLAFFSDVFNFTISHDKTSSGLWGSESSNDSDKCQSFSNIGEIASGAYDFSGAHWKVLPYRPCVIEYARPCFFLNEEIFVNQRGKQGMDEFLFLRPFHEEAWIFLTGILGIFCCCFYVEKVALLKGEFSLVSTVFWIFFMLIQAYYSGAMTMFFAGTSEIPFRNIPEAAEIFPKWKPVLQSGVDNNFGQKLPQDIAQSFLNQIRADNLFKPDLRQVLEFMKRNAKTYTFADRIMVLFELNKRQHNIDLQSFQLKGIEQAGLILGRFSPYKRMFNQGIQSISETGVLNFFIVSKFRNLQSLPFASEKVILSWHHLAPGILFYMAILMLTPGLVLVEKLHRHIKRNKSNKL